MRSRHGRPDGALLLSGTRETARLDPLWGSGEPIYLWAQDGMICCEDGRTNGGFRTIGWRDMAERVQALSEMAINSSEDRTWAEERIAIQRFVVAAERVIAKARAQGAPFDNGESLHSVVRKRKQKIIPQKQRLHRIEGDIF